MPLIQEMDEYKGLSNEEVNFIRSSPRYVRAWKSREWTNFSFYRHAMLEQDKNIEENSDAIKDIIKFIFKWGLVFSPFVILNSLNLDRAGEFGESLGFLVLAGLPAFLIWSIINYIQRG